MNNLKHIDMAELIKTNKKYFGLGQVPIGIGAIMKGWDISEEDFRNPSILPVVDFRAMTATCFHDCFHCFTDKNKRTLSLGTIKRVIGEIAQMGARGIDFLGEGEPTLDKNFFEIVEFTQAQGIIPIVFTDGATKLEDKNFIKRLKDSGCSVCPKCDSLFNPEYQNWVVGDKTNRYFERRNEVVKLLMEAGFNEVSPLGTTRLGFDMVVSSKNIREVPETLRFCRKNNIWIAFSFYLPAGRSGNGNFNKSLMPSKEEMDKMRESVRQID